MDSGFWIFILLAMSFVCGFLSANIAEHKGYFTRAWFGAGFFLGIFGLIAAAGLPKKQILPQIETKKCPQCAEEVKYEAKLCHYCNNLFPYKKIFQCELEKNGEREKKIRLNFDKNESDVERYLVHEGFKVISVQLIEEQNYID